MFIPREPAKWMDGGTRSKLMQVVSYGQGHYYFYLILSKYPLRLDSESKKNMVGYPLRPRIHLSL